MPTHPLPEDEAVTGSEIAKSHWGRRLGEVVGSIPNKMSWRWYWKSWEKCEDLVHSSWRLTQSILLIGTVLPLVLVVWKLYSSSPLEPRTAPVASQVTQRNETALISVTDIRVPIRPLLPYSVIPGGARDAIELRAAVAHDRVVALHYILFDIPNTRTIRLDHNEAMYVSYRMGDHVFWTNKKLMLLKGETLLTDGQHLARTRCGNRLSETPEVPTSLREPDRSALETPAAPELTGIVAPPPELPLGPIGPLLVPPAETTPSTKVFIPPIVPIFWGGGPPATPSIPAPPPRVGIPEPSPLLLLYGGVGALLVWNRKRRTVV